VDRARDGVVQRSARLGENDLDVFKSLPRLRRDPTLDQFPRLRIDTLLTGYENQVANLNSLRIRPDRLRCVGASELLLDR
jgi:hypothetical protein